MIWSYTRFKLLLVRTAQPEERICKILSNVPLILLNQHRPPVFNVYFFFPTGDSEADAPVYVNQISSQYLNGGKKIGLNKKNKSFLNLLHFHKPMFTNLCVCVNGGCIYGTL